MIPNAGQKPIGPRIDHVIVHRLSMPLTRQQSVSFHHVQVLAYSITRNTQVTSDLIDRHPPLLQQVTNAESVRVGQHPQNRRRLLQPVHRNEITIARLHNISLYHDLMT